MLTDKETEMQKHSAVIGRGSFAALLVLGLTLLAAPAGATQQGQERRGARDTRQDTRQESRHDKVDCRQADQKNNAQCRQDKRETKQGGRQEARDIKY
ncbi:hypothetical protein [Niveibacterium sp. SC-1]|uniref:hypothetical protein n=1 Tax=Niveibacterium sp. SC-1 TaxID=3135646 RepID=UPI00311DADAA